MDRNINFSSTSILDTSTGHMDCMIKEAIEIRVHYRNFNRDKASVTNMLK
jgi:hypothetical protein